MGPLTLALLQLLLPGALSLLMEALTLALLRLLLLGVLPAALLLLSWRRVLFPVQLLLGPLTPALLLLMVALAPASADRLLHHGCHAGTHLTLDRTHLPGSLHAALCAPHSLALRLKMLCSVGAPHSLAVAGLLAARAGVHLLLAYAAQQPLALHAAALSQPLTHALLPHPGAWGPGTPPGVLVGWACGRIWGEVQRVRGFSTYPKE